MPPITLSAPDPNSYLKNPKLATLVKWVRQWKPAARKLAAAVALIEREKALRKDIDALLAAGGLQRNELVTCLGYEVIRRGQDGRSSINTETLLELLVEKGLTREAGLDVIKRATDKGDPSTWSELRPMKGANVRAA